MKQRSPSEEILEKGHESKKMNDWGAMTKALDQT